MRADVGVREGDQARGGLDTARGLVAFVILLAIFVTLNPYVDLGSVDPVEGTSGTEAPTYIALFLVTIAAAALLHHPAQFMRAIVATRTNILLFGWILVVGVGMSVAPGMSARRLVLASLAYLLAAMLPWLTSGLRQFASLLLITAAIVLVLCYLGVMLAPAITIHQARDIAEPELAGDWRGIYNHKAAAASVMALFVYFGWFAALRGKAFAGAVIAGFAFVFLIFSGGKSELAMLFLAPLVGFFVTRSKSLWMKFVLVLGPLLTLAFLTIGSVIFEPARDILRALSIDPTFTGRSEIWRFAFDAISISPWTGHGYEAFWYSEGLRHSSDDQTRWMAGVATSHNSYVDLALTIGIPGLALTLVAFVVVPLRDFHRALPTRENAALSQFFLILWLYALYLGTFEAFFLSRASPIWFALAMALCGLRSTALFPAKE